MKCTFWAAAFTTGGKHASLLPPGVQDARYCFKWYFFNILNSLTFQYGMLEMKQYS